MTMTKKQVSKFLTVLTRVETLEKELEPGKERERLSDAKLELQRGFLLRAPGRCEHCTNRSVARIRSMSACRPGASAV
jgi:hypothetical protein